MEKTQIFRNKALSISLSFYMAFFQISPAGWAFSVSDFPAKVPVKSDYYSIQTITPGEEGFLKFHVTSVHATYDVEGFLPLMKVLREIEVIEQVRRDERSSGFFDGAAASIEATGTGMVNLVAHPVASAKGVGKAAGKLGRSIGGVFRKKEETEKSSFGEKMLGSSERELAKEFGVDVYSRNPYLKALLTSMARARAGGKGAVMVVKFLIPVAFVASVALTAGGINGAADQLVNNSSRADLVYANQNALMAMGFPTAQIKTFLNMPYYTPREQTYVRFYLEKLKGVQGSRAIFTKVLNSKSDWDAQKILFTSQLVAGAAEKTPFAELKIYDEGIAAKDAAGKVFFMTPYDNLEHSGFGEKILSRLKEIKNSGANGLELWNGGRISQGFSILAFAQGVRTRHWLFLKDGAPSEA